MRRYHRTNKVSYRFQFILFLFFLAFFFTANAQYVSPFKYENGNFRVKTSAEISAEQSRIQPYNYTTSQTKASTTQKTPSTPFNHEEYVKYIETRRTQDSLKRKKAILDQFTRGSSLNTEHDRLKKLIQESMDAMDYKAADSITYQTLNYTFEETLASSNWDYYRARLGNRLLSQVYLGRIDSAWQVLKRIEESDQWALGKGIYVPWTLPKDISIMKVFLLYEGGAFDAAFQTTQAFITSRPEEEKFWGSYQEIYCLQSRILLAMNKTKEAKTNLDNYLQKTDQQSSLIRNAHGWLQPYIAETYGLIFLKQNLLDSALFYFKMAAKTPTEYTALHGYARHYNLPVFSTIIGRFTAPVRMCFLYAPMLGGYNINDPADEGYQMLDIANNMSIPEAGYILEHKVAFKPPVNDKKVPGNQVGDKPKQPQRKIKKT